MDVEGALLVGRAVADDRAHRDERGSIAHLLGGAERLVHRAQVVTVLHRLDVPAVGRIARAHVFAERDGGRARERDAVVVVQDDELAQLEVAGQRSGLGLHALHHVAVACQDVGVVVDDLVPRPIEARGQVRLGDRHAHRIAHALAERPRGRLDALGQMALGMPRRETAPLAELLDLVERQVVTRQMQQRVEKHGAVARGEDEAVTVGPGRIRWVVVQESGPQHVGRRGRAHGQAGVAGVRLLHSVNREETNGVDGSFFQALFSHGRLPCGMRYTTGAGKSSTLTGPSQPLYVETP